MYLSTFCYVLNVLILIVLVSKCGQTHTQVCKILLDPIQGTCVLSLDLAKLHMLQYICEINKCTYLLKTS